MTHLVVECLSLEGAQPLNGVTLFVVTLLKTLWSCLKSFPLNSVMLILYAVLIRGHFLETPFLMKASSQTLFSPLKFHSPNPVDIKSTLVI